MEKKIKKIITKDNIQTAAMLGLLITSFQLIFLLIKRFIETKKIS
jgi:hypothetical protein